MNTHSGILLIEDCEDDALLMKRAIRKAGIEEFLHVALDGQEALDYLAGSGRYKCRQEYPLPGFVFLDLKLPRVSGLEVLKQLRQLPETKALIVIVLTSSNHPSDVNKAYELGANSYVVKPPAFEQLTEFVRAFKQFWLTFNAKAPANGVASS